MATHVSPGDSIECNRSRVTVRKVSKNPVYVNIQSLQGEPIKLFKYKSNIRAIILITEQLDPLHAIISATSRLLLNENLEGDVIEIYTKERMKFSLYSNFSHVHGIQGDDVNSFTYAKIVIPWEFALRRQIAG